MNQGKLEVVKKEMARVNTDILGISEPKWTRVGEFNSDEGYVVRGILQARMLEWIAFPFSRGTFQPRDQTQVLCIVEQFLYQLSHSGSDK